jgi:hypothetical protein
LPAFDSGAKTPFPIRETRSQIVAPRRIGTLSSTRDNIHYFEAGDAGARGPDITTVYGGDGSFSFVAFQPVRSRLGQACNSEGAKMANTDLSSATIGQASINVHDVDRAVAFYRDTLGLRFLFQAGPKMAFFDCGGVRLMLAVPEKPEFDHPRLGLLFQGG